MSRWYDRLVKQYAALDGYEQPVDRGGTRMDSNENFVMPRGYQDQILGARTPADIRAYPAGGTAKLARALARRLHVPASRVCVGNGSDQLLDMMLCFFAGPRTPLVTSDPTFSFFEARCKLYGVPVTRVPFSDGMTLDPDDVRAKMARSSMLYLDSPNNPTGFQFTRGQIDGILDGYEGLAVIDEAYAGFGRPSAVPLTSKHDNLIVTGTLSKSHGLAGLRAGYMVAPSDIASVFNGVLQYPYPLGSLSVEAAVGALARPGPVASAAKLVRSERVRVTRELRRLPAVEAFNSQANFVLFDVGGAEKRVYTALLEQNISVRRVGRIGKHVGCLRVTMGTREMNSRFLSAMRDLLA